MVSGGACVDSRWIPYNPKSTQTLKPYKPYTLKAETIRKLKDRITPHDSDSRMKIKRVQEVGN